MKPFSIQDFHGSELPCTRNALHIILCRAEKLRYFPRKHNGGQGHALHHSRTAKAGVFLGRGKQSRSCTRLLETLRGLNPVHSEDNPRVVHMDKTNRIFIWIIRYYMLDLFILGYCAMQLELRWGFRGGTSCVYILYILVGYISTILGEWGLLIVV